MTRIRVVVTGMGAVSCLGVGVEALWNGLVQRRSGRREIESFDASKYRSSQAAEVAWTALPAAVVPARDADESERAVRLALLASDEALADAQLDTPAMADAGCVVGTLCGSAQVFEQYGATFNKAPQSGDDAFPDVDTCLVSHQLETLVAHYGLRGPATLVSTACSSSTDAIGYAADFIRSGETQVMLAGGSDILSEVVHAGFNAVFSITMDRPRPFDTQRTGFVIGEGAGMLVLESLEHAQARGAHIYAELMGYGLSNAAFHLTATSEDGKGESLAVQRCLKDSGVAASEVSYVNVHGTSTSHNDLTEVQSMHGVFGDKVSQVAVSSIKPNIGHCMGAAGALEAIATIKCIESGFVPGMLDTSADLDPQLGFVLGDGRALPIRYALSQSFGFGGACSSILFSNPVDSISGSSRGANE